MQMDADEGRIQDTDTARTVELRASPKRRPDRIATYSTLGLTTYDFCSK
ncbi:hypothetical protein CGMCC3_g2610 [Colletotrichum fructicola]|nr:uncharacterized protein CGMCC3_g2610 [Colletotrichum fructicola]KAE9581321.1 hypothetical protein CGMCC3_g2610 [Colletotrichum fructicola]